MEKKEEKKKGRGKLRRGLKMNSKPHLNFKAKYGKVIQGTQAHRHHLPNLKKWNTMIQQMEYHQVMRAMNSVRVQAIEVRYGNA